MPETRVVNKRTDEYDIYIGRPSPWGNRFVIGPDGTREQVIEKYRDWIMRQPELIERAKRELKGRVLGCFCKPLPCHGDVLKEIADA